MYAREVIPHMHAMCHISLELYLCEGCNFAETVDQSLDLHDENKTHLLPPQPLSQDNQPLLKAPRVLPVIP